MVKIGAMVALLVLLAGCATAPAADPPSADGYGPVNVQSTDDPAEPFNRAMFAVNEKFDKYVILPIADIYIYYLPARMRDGLHNFVANLDLPVTFANDVFQGRFQPAAEDVGRLAMNSTVGLGGFVDVASRAGMPPHTSDFGQTLALWGAPEGPFLVLPVIGPEPPRDLLGDAVDLAFDPLTYLPAAWPLSDRIGTVVGLHVANPFEIHARNIYLRQQLETQSLDPYTTMKSAWRQARDTEIHRGMPSEDESLPQ